MSLKRITGGTLLCLALALGGGGPVATGPSGGGVVYFYRDGQAVPVARAGPLPPDREGAAAELMAWLLAGPTPEEQAGGLASALPAGAALAALSVAGDAARIALRLPPDFLRTGLDPAVSDALVVQVVKTLHPLGLHHVDVRAPDAAGQPQPVSAFLARPAPPAPAVPANDDPVPALKGAEYTGQPPLPGQGRPQGALSGKTVWLSAGHGWYWSDTLSRWNSQRPNCYGIVEDFSNAEAVNAYLAHYLWNAGAEVWWVREHDSNEREIVVDNDAGAPGYVETGVWTTSSSPGYHGGSYRWASTGGVPATATWRPDLPAAGWYSVWAWYRHGENRPAEARYEIHHAGGVTPVRLSQEVHGLTWRWLGDYYFEAGTGGAVTLLNESADAGQAVIADAVRFGGGMGSIAAPGGTSGQPRWEEAARYWAAYQGAPDEITSSDVTARPLYAEWESAKGYPGEAGNAVYVSWHTNAGGGTGTESYIHSFEPTPGSAELQAWVHAELVGDLRAGWNGAWRDRGQKSADFGELRELSAIPGVLLEVAFHDTEDPGDADDLRQPAFRQIAARAVFQGVVKYFAARSGEPAHLLPEPPVRLAARNSGPGRVTLTWAPPPCCNGVVGDGATSYKVYRSADGRAFDDGVQVDTPSYTVAGLAPGTMAFFRVTALNAGGESFPTPVVGARTPAGGGPVHWLLVDGFDRLDESALIPQWESAALGTARRMFLERMNAYDYAAIHGRALSSCGLGFDGATDEAVAAGDVPLAGYPAVDWFAGEDSVADFSLSSADRSRLAAYLDGGGALLLSGAEIGYDLVQYGRDPAFYGQYLKAGYGGDDAGTYQVAGAPGGIFAGLAGRFDDGTGGTYEVGYPDRLAAAGGSSAVLSYVGGSGGGAAVAYGGAFRVVYLGFPLETVTDPALRTALMCAAAGYLLEGYEPPAWDWRSYLPLLVK